MYENLEQKKIEKWNGVSDCYLVTQKEWNEYRQWLVSQGKASKRTASGFEGLVYKGVPLLPVGGKVEG
ncbi:MAG: hypothetical protein AAB706_00900 [Patescibacteria group bacterium]